MSKSLSPQNISRSVWYYENNKSIDVYIRHQEVRHADANTVVIRIPVRKLAATLNRLSGDSRQEGK